MRKSISVRFLSFALFGAVTLFFSACGGGGNNDLGDRIGTSDPSIRFANMLPNAQLSLYRNGSNDGLNENGILYGTVTKFSDFKSENSIFSVRNPANLEIGTAGSISGANGHRYLAVAFPDLTASSGTSTVALQVLDDPYNRKASVAPTVRIINAVPGFERFDIYVTKPNDPIGSPSVADFGFQSFWPASGNDAQKLDDSNNKFRVRITISGNPGAILFDSQELQLDENADAVIVVMPVQPGLTAPVNRGDLKIRVDDGNKKNDSGLEVVDHPI